MGAPARAGWFLAAIASGLLLGLGAGGCLNGGAPVCASNLKACGTTCADVSSDAANCGGCGNACAAGQVCQNGTCECQPGATFCGGSCVVLSTDPDNCGGCAEDGGTVCAANQVCDQGTCRNSCALGTSTACGQSCVDTQTDPNHCGSCDVACGQAQACNAGSCAYGAIGACFDIGELVAVAPDGALKSAAQAVDASPQLLASDPPVLFVADGLDGNLYQARLSDLTELPRTTTIGTDPEGMLVDRNLLYIVTDGTPSLNVFLTSPADGGFDVSALSGYAFPANSFPHRPAQVGKTLYVPLYGPYGDATYPQTVARVDVTDPSNLSDAGTIDLTGLDLHAFDGGSAAAKPSAATSFNGKVYVALSNLNPTNYVPAGPALLAEIDPSDGGLSEVNLGSDVCLDPVDLAVAGSYLVVSCGGQSDYSQFPKVTTTKSGLVLVNAADQRVASWSAACPSDAGGCADPLLGPVSTSGTLVYATDQNAGRLFVLDVADGGFTELRGFATASGPIQLCTGADGGTSGQEVSDVAVP